MTGLEKAQRKLAQAVTQRAVTECASAALSELESVGLEASDLGKWSYLVPGFDAAPKSEPFPPDLISGSVDLFDDDRKPPDIRDAANGVHEEKYRSDLSVRLSGALSDVSNGGDPAAVLERITRSLASVRDGRSAARGEKALTAELPKLADKVNSGQATLKCVPTCISRLDAVIYGWQPTLNLLGADPGVGKSALMVQTLYENAKAGRTGAMFCLEDPPSFICNRLVSRISGVELLRILYGKLSKEELDKVNAALEEIGRHSDRMLVYDSSDRPMAVERLCSMGRSMVKNDGAEYVLVDHAGELKSTERDRHDLEVSGQLASLRGLANGTGVPVIVAMHMKRRPYAKPTIQDFANSSGAERKARVAIGLTREPGKDIVQAHILKQTNGPSGISVDLKMDLSSGTIA